MSFDNVSTVIADTTIDFSECNEDVYNFCLIDRDTHRVCIERNVYAKCAATKNLLAAIERNEHDTAVIANLARLAYLDSEDGWLLTQAAKRNNFPIVSGLLEFGANPNGRKGWPLIYAARNDNRDMVDLLLGNGASAAALNSESLLESAFNQNLMMTETLIRHGAKASMRHSLPLYWAALHGNVHLAQLLIRHGARFDEWWWNGSQIFQRLSLTELGIISRNPDDNSDEIYKDMYFSHVSDRIKDLAVV